VLAVRGLQGDYPRDYRHAATSNGNGLNGAIVHYYSGGWKSFGTTASDGTARMVLAVGTYNFQISYAGATLQSSQDVSNNPNVKFRTVQVHSDSGKCASYIQRFALSVGLSLALVPLVGLLLNYTPRGIRLNPIVVSLTILTVGLAMVAVAGDYRLSKIVQTVNAA
jgi:hypothetical protein